MQRPSSLIFSLTPDLYHLLLAAVNYGARDGSNEAGVPSKPSWRKRAKRLKERLELIYN